MIAKVLTEEQVGKIHQKSLSILETVGVVIPHPEILGRFGDSGAKVDLKENRVRIPSDLVSKLINNAGKKFTLYGRDTSLTAKFGYGTRNYNSAAGGPLWVEDIGGQAALCYDGRCRKGCPDR